MWKASKARQGNTFTTRTDDNGEDDRMAGYSYVVQAEGRTERGATAYGS